LPTRPDPSFAYPLESRFTCSEWVAHFPKVNPLAV
jgi:hypothetical protein